MSEMEGRQLCLIGWWQIQNFLGPQQGKRGAPCLVLESSLGTEVPVAGFAAGSSGSVGVARVSH